MTAPIPNVIGIAIGIPVTLMGNHPIQNMLHGLKGTDLISLAVSAVLLLGVAILAGYFPAQRASRVDPMIALNCRAIAESLVELTSYFVFRVDHGLSGNYPVCAREGA